MTDDFSLDLIVAPHPTHKTVGDGDFRAQVDDGTLYLPHDVYDWGKEETGCLDSGQEYITSILLWKELLAEDLGWTNEQMYSACDKFVAQLEGLLPDSVLHPEPPPQRRYGALPPERFKNHKTADDYKKND